ncbi:succinate dehydrogenase, cytochrome b556 subunit [Pseudooceanicola sp. CBS1P-1]|uniref:Succinate dehydrogenase cytochrome b556 subunit n=1 Tax=Pseudooceanicola albus TaxID=2692189 RepID=A0A6L7G6A2_9RHOB|nr:MULTISPECIES: succinate dehydrogenase, cytochrome b556 subunit [Pseudooceanicola]MBT9384803.1 succinate dehydrogenase, cytochrome b556 subunit [Pseudooceanicola endophyticus]MXN18203.1 succinate dehydrogenase, cytochrome b556 subunit [Pseudooceanicola albus]
MADVNRGNRPLSPFMLGKYYKFQLNSVTSILTRITGNALVVEAFLIAWWLIAAATGPDYFAVADFVVTSWIGDLILLLSTLGLWYHALAGIRHLIWDNGYCLDMKSADKLGWIVIYGSLVLTIITIIFV